jgi:hypothetical protein
MARRRPWPPRGRSAGPQLIEIDDEADDREGRGPLRVRPHVVEHGLVRHAVERDVGDREGFTS